ncbi:hypothetical protein ABKV19_025242 [Rosa sericea]
MFEGLSSKSMLADQIGNFNFVWSLRTITVELRTAVSVSDIEPKWSGSYPQGLPRPRVPVSSCCEDQASP